MAITDTRQFSGATGPVRNARAVSLDSGAFEDQRGFVWTAQADGTYTYRPQDAGMDLMQTLAAGEYATVGGVAVLSVIVRQAAGLSIIVANL